MNFLTEALIVIVILAVAFVAFLGALGQALQVSREFEKATEVLAVVEPLLFEVERGLRLDLLEEGVGVSARAEKAWVGGRRQWDVDVRVLRAAVQ